ALEGEDLFEAAKHKGLTIFYEAAVAGGIPIISTLKQSLQGNRIEKLMGIINGTTNYILDSMKQDNKSFDDALKNAQALGFAESNPANDIEGHDAAYKIAILASIISNKRVDVNKVYREGITKITTQDIKSADKRGFTIKLLGIIENTSDQLDIRVHPVLVPMSNPLSAVKMENNAILIKGNAVQELTLIGKGAGSLPTASSVFGDVLILASQLSQGAKPNPQFTCKHTAYAKMKDIDDVKNSFYIRVAMHDKVGVLKDLGEITSKNGANVKFIDQYDVYGEEAKADFIIDPITEKAAKQMIKDIQALDSIKNVESIIRVL
ncbi:MAG: homoserine dehydrogenase, partial [Candidatus Caenarcaniphilales bacterium]|nr:homoserine dehydrogenase [Candidatus Caenarcaniphilales bacterium]